MRVHVEWGEWALDDPAPVAIIVDCLSFSSALSVACTCGAEVYPFGLRDGAHRFADLMQLQIVGKRKAKGLSLSPPSLNRLSLGDRIVLPSPNGSHLTMFAKQKTVFCGALRNARAVAQAAAKLGEDVIIVAAGERWQKDGSLRPAFEDWVAAGAIASYFDETAKLSAEARLAKASFTSIANNIRTELADCISGQELIQRGFIEDVKWASEMNATAAVPQLKREDRTYAEIGLTADDVPAQEILDMKICRYVAD